jgi:lactoylglutathione lyase
MSGSTTADLGPHIQGLSHIGIRVHDLARSRAFYERLGFRFEWGPAGPEPVAAMRHASGLEINFILNAKEAKVPNILMDVPEKHPGYTHIALKIDDVARTEAALTSAGIAVTGRRGSAALFVRDPDGNVIELAAD